MSDYTKVVLEAYPGGRLNISALDANGYGHGYRISGPKFNHATIIPTTFGPPVLRKLDPLVTHELDDRDAKEIRSYLRTVDRIHGAGWPEQVHELTDSLDRWKAHAQGVPNFPKSREPQTRAALVQACRALLNQLDPPTALGRVGLRKLIVDTAATEDADGWSVDIDDETADRIAEAIFTRLGAA